MKKKPFAILMVVLIVLMLMTGYAVWETFFADNSAVKTIRARDFLLRFARRRGM